MSTERSIPHLRDIFGLSINHKNPDPIYNHQKLEEKPEKKSKRSTSKSTSNGTANGNGELKTLERHLSMKKTIRKKIMRDLQQAFVDDPSEFKVENNQDDRLKAELNLEAMRYGDSKHRSRKSDNFLDMLRGGDQNLQTGNGMTYNNNNNNSHLGIRDENNCHSHPAMHNNNNQGVMNTTATTNEKQSFWSRFGIRNKNKR